MAESTPELRGLQNILEAQMPTALSDMNPPPNGFFWSGGVAPLPPTRVQRVKTKIWLTQRDARERVALLVAPWLERDPSDW